MTPQRSRRLSASGIPSFSFVATSRIGPQRSRRLSASGITGRRAITPHVNPTSKKQTPFSVWYAFGAELAPDAVNLTSKKQTPFSVWYRGRRSDQGRRAFHLKEADAFQRLVWTSGAAATARRRHLKEADAFQRLVFGGVVRGVYLVQYTSKKQTPFSVWYIRSAAATQSCGAWNLKEADAFQRLVS